MIAPRMPTAEELYEIAEHHPIILSGLVAYFIFDWVGIYPNGIHGIDQNGKVRQVPDLAGMLGVDWCHAALRSGDPRGYLDSLAPT